MSAASAAQVIEALRSRDHDVVVIDLARGRLSASDEAALLAAKIAKAPPARTARDNLPAVVSSVAATDLDLAFLALHGGSGENGTIQSVLDLAGMPYTGSGRLGSALAWDKAVAKQLFLAAGVPTPPWLLAPQTGAAVAEALDYPVIVKPGGQGSTVGLSRVDRPDALADAIAIAERFDSEVLIERFVPGRELTVGILGDEALAVGEIIPAHGDIFDYEAKYQAGGAAEIFPADVSAETASEVQRLGLAAHRALKLNDYSRVDFRMDPAGGLWCLEVNTLPGLSSGSLLPQSAAAAGIDFPTLCERICAAALVRHSRGGSND